MGKAVPFVTGFREAACTLMAAGMAESDTAAAACAWVTAPNWLRLHATPSCFHPGIRGGVGGCQPQLLLLPLRASEKRGSERCIKLFNLCKYHFPGDRL